MDPIKLKLLQEIMSHMDNIQGGGLKSMMDQTKMDAMKPSMPDGMSSSMDKVGMNDDDGDEMDALGKPKGLKMESVEIMGKKNPMDLKGPMDGPVTGEDDEPDGDEMSDDELKELLSHFLR